jgi:hypothetical protein
MRYRRAKSASLCDRDACRKEDIYDQNKWFNEGDPDSP